MKLSIYCFVVLYFFCSEAFSQDLPDDPGSKPIDPEDNWVHGTIGPPELVDPLDALAGDVFCQRAGMDPSVDYTLMPGGILMSEQKAKRCAEYKLAYEELRKLYIIDIGAWKTKTTIYTSELDLCQKKVNELTKKAKKGWWDKNKFTVGMLLGVVVGVAVTGAVAVAAFKIVR